MTSIGMMDQGYFVSRREIFTWIKQTLKLEVTSLEELGRGDIYCRLITHFHPGAIQMTKIVKAPKMKHDIILNLKHLQNGIDRLGI